VREEGLSSPHRDEGRLRAAVRREHLTTYTFNTGVAKHTFCRVCGVHAFYTPRSHPDGVDVNVRCLDGDAVTRFTLVPFDGKHWEENVETIR
jgi:hypothetical protein